MQIDQLVDLTENINGTTVNVIKRQTDIVPIVFEQFNQGVDFIHIGCVSAMGIDTIHTYDVNSSPPSNIGLLIPYSRNFIKPRNFICFLDYLGRINSIHQYHPDNEKINTYREKTFSSLFGFDLYRKSPAAELQHCTGGRWLRWNSFNLGWNNNPKSKRRTIQKVAKRVNKSTAPLVVNVSLDSFNFLESELNEGARKEMWNYTMRVCGNGLREMQALWNGQDKYLHYSSEPLLKEHDPDFYSFTAEKVTEEDYRIRRQNFLGLIRELRKPELVVVSESQKPIPTCPPERVEHLEAMVFSILEEELKGK